MLKYSQWKSQLLKTTQARIWNESKETANEVIEITSYLNIGHEQKSVKRKTEIFLWTFLKENRRASQINRWENRKGFSILCNSNLLASLNSVCPKTLKVRFSNRNSNKTLKIDA